MPPAPASTRDLERHDRLGPTTAGALTGGIGGAAVLAIAARLVEHRGGPDLLARAGAYVAHLLHASLAGVQLAFAAFVGAAVVGAVGGALFATTTRRLRRFGPLLVWSFVFFPSAWIAVHAFVLPRVAPGLRGELPLSVMLLAMLVYVVVVPLALPVRRRAAPRWDAVDVDE